MDNRYDKNTEVLKEIVEELKAMDGQAGFYYKSLVTGETAEFRADEQFLPASIVKLPLMAAILLLRSQGKTNFRDLVTMKEEEKIPGCGAIQHITGDVTLDVETMSKLMITISDSAATNALLRYYTTPVIRECFLQLGMEGTQFNRCYWDAEKEAKGINNYFVPREIGQLLEQMHYRTLVDEESSVWLETIMRQQQINHKMGGQLPMDFPMAHKTGDEEDKAHDVGIVYAERPFIVCYAYVGPDMRSYEDFIRRTTRKLVLANGTIEGAMAVKE
ncbi:MAG: serine hydrolase [Firmicutes bacterium]|nr:serine hydrolase [Bacillota bacterium]